MPIEPWSRDPSQLPVVGRSKVPAAMTASSLLDGLRTFWDLLQSGLQWMEEHEQDIRVWGRDVARRGGPTDPWRYLFTKVDVFTSLTMRAGLELERRLTPANRGETLTLLLGDMVRDETLLDTLDEKLKANVALSSAHRDQLLLGIAQCRRQRDHLAVPLLINSIEGLFWRAAADRGLIERTKSGKWICTSRTTSPRKKMHGVEQVIDLPELALDDAFRAFLQAVVYGGDGDPFRHGTATRGWHLRASFLIIAIMGWLEIQGQLDVAVELRAALERVRQHQRSLSQRGI